jgi:DNA-binding NarL/FixJ family response regulator
VILTMISILVVEQPAVMRRTLCARLAVEADLQVVGEADDVSSAATLAPALQPHVVLLDAEMPGLNVREAVRTLCASSPPSRLLILTLDTLAVSQQLDAGTTVVVGKVEGASALVAAIRATAAGGQGD